MSAAEPLARPPQESISQFEIEKLLSEMGGGDAAATGSPTAVRESAPEHFAQVHKFPQLSFFSGSELRKLRMKHEELIRSLAAQLAIYLRMDCVLQMSKLETIPFERFVDGIANPTYLSLFKLEPLRGICLLDISPRLALCVVDRQLGGAAVKVDEARGLSEIEIKLVSRVVEMIVSEWCSFWRQIVDLRPVLLGHETNARFVQACPPETMMLVIGMEAWLGGEIVDQMQFAFPYYTLEPLIEQLNANDANGEVQPRGAGPLRWNPALDDMRLNLSAELPKVKVNTRELAQLKPGDVLPLSPEMINHVRLRLGKKVKFEGVLGTTEDHRAVRITRFSK